MVAYYLCFTVAQDETLGGCDKVKKDLHCSHTSSQESPTLVGSCCSPDFSLTEEEILKYCSVSLYAIYIRKKPDTVAKKSGKP
jgi:hypothetical protein